MGTFGRISMRTFVLLQCILVTSSLRSQASPSRQGALATAQKYYKVDAEDKIDSCNEEHLRFAKMKLVDSDTEVVERTDDVDRFIKMHKEIIKFKIESYEEKLQANPSAGACEKITVVEGTFKVPPENTKDLSNALAEWLERLLVDGNEDDALKLAEAMEDQPPDADAGVSKEYFELLDWFMGLTECSGGSSNDDSADVQTEISKCQAADAFLTDLKTENEITKEPAVQHSKALSEIRNQILLRRDKPGELLTATTSVQDRLQEISEKANGLEEAAGELKSELQETIGDMEKVKKNMDDTRKKFELISRLTGLAVEQKKAIDNVEKNVQQIIINAVTYHRNSLDQLIEWYGKKPTQKPIDTFSVSSKLNDLVEYCQKYTTQEITMRDGALHIQGTAVLNEKKLQESSSDLVSVLSTNKICASMTKDTTEKYLKHFDSQMTREWTHTMKAIDTHTKAFQHIKIARDDAPESDMEILLDIYWEVFKSNKFYKQYLSYWKTYFPAIKVVVAQMHDDVKTVSDMLVGQQAQEEVQQKTLKALIAKLEKERDGIKSKLATTKFSQAITEQTLKELESQMVKCQKDLEELRKMAEEQDALYKEANSKYVKFIQQGSSLLSMRSKSRLSQG